MSAYRPERPIRLAMRLLSAMYDPSAPEDEKRAIRSALALLREAMEQIAAAAEEEAERAQALLEAAGAQR